MYADDSAPGSSAGSLLARVSGALDERVGDRMVLISRELDAGRGERAEDALRMALWLMRDYRGDYAQLVGKVGGHLCDRSAGPDVRMMAVHALEDLHELAVPAADAIAEVLADARREHVGDANDRFAAASSWYKGRPARGSARWWARWRGLVIHASCRSCAGAWRTRSRSGSWAR
jgi:hypothetical protein